MLKPIPCKEWPSLHTVRQAHEVAPISGFTAHFVDRAALVAECADKTEELTCERCVAVDAELDGKWWPIPQQHSVRTP